MWEGENEEGFVSSSLKSGHHILFRVLFALPSLIRGGLTASRRPLNDPICFLTATTTDMNVAG